MATKIADSLGVSLDYLTGLSDQLLDKDDQDHLLVMVDAFLRDAKTRKAYAK